MSKKAEKIMGTFSLDNLKKANSISKKSEIEKPIKKKKSIQFMVDKECAMKFKKLQYQFIMNSSEEEFYSLISFFRICLLFLLEKENIERQKDERILSLINRRGKRMQDHTFRIINKENSYKLFFGYFDDDTDDLYDIVMCYFSKNNMEYIESFSKGFFFFDLVDYIGKNIKILIKEYK